MKNLTADRLDYLRAAADDVPHSGIVQELLAHIGAITAERDAAEARALAAETDIARLLKTFRHTHVAGTTRGLNIDECAKCGLDLRNAIHAIAKVAP